MLSTQRAWLTMIAAVLGVDATACQKVSPQASPAGSAEITPVPSTVGAAPPPSASVANTDIVVADASMIDSGKAVKVAQAIDSGIDMASLDSLFSDQDLSNSQLDRLAQSSCGVSNQSNDLRFGNTHGIGGLASIGRDGGTSVRSGPVGDATVTLVSGGVGNDLRVVAGMRPGFRSCWNTSLNQNPATPGGRITLNIVVAPNGDVSSTTPTSTVPAVTQCIAGRAKRASFDAQPSPRTLVVTVDLKAP